MGVKQVDLHLFWGHAPIDLKLTKSGAYPDEKSSKFLPKDLKSWTYLIV